MAGATVTPPAPATSPFFQSARGLAHSKTLPAIRGGFGQRASVFGLRRPSSAFPRSAPVFGRGSVENSSALVGKKRIVV